MIAGGNDQDHVAGASSTDDSTLEPGDAGQDEWSSPTNEDLGDDDEDPVVIVTTPTTEPVAATRQAQLWARTAKLRDAPRLDATEIRTFTDEEGRAVTVIGALDAGWYEVEIDGMHGFLYGGLVTPPDPGHCVLLMGDGWPYAKQSTRVIVSISPSGDLVATLPEGGEVVVTSGDIRDQQCA
ncbi:MAG: SH3 domain-containing protein [Actinobacteria bacterium]|nr:SH3 domain-containing protein [Actinomycetota bacterium]